MGAPEAPAEPSVAASRSAEPASTARPRALAVVPLLPALLAADRSASRAFFEFGRLFPRIVWRLFEAGGDGRLWIPLCTVAASGLPFVLLRASRGEAVGASETSVSGSSAPPTSPLVPRSVTSLLSSLVPSGCAPGVSESLLFDLSLLAANTLVGLAVDLVLVGLCKLLFKRPRPAYNVQEDFTVVVSVDAHSFPSGHAARTAFLALFMSRCLGEGFFRPAAGRAAQAAGAAGALGRLAGAARAVGPQTLWWTWALATSLSRVAMGRHYLLDVAAGFALGQATARVATGGTLSRQGWWVSGRMLRDAWERIWGVEL